MNPPGEQPRAADESTLAQSLQLLNLLRHAPTRSRLVLLAALIVAVIILNAVAQVRLNSWQGSFYDSLAQRNLGLFYRELGVFAIIVSVLLVLGVAQTWFHELLKVKLREAVTFDLIDEWLRPKRAYRLPLAGDIGDHPDQRIQDDARRLVELCVELGVGLVQSTVGKPTHDLLGFLDCASFLSKTGRPLFEMMLIVLNQCLRESNRLLSRDRFRHRGE